MYHRRLPKLMSHNLEKKGIWNGEIFPNIKKKEVPDLNEYLTCPGKLLVQFGNMKFPPEMLNHQDT